MRALNILTLSFAIVASTAVFGQSQDITPEEAQKRVEERAEEIRQEKARNDRLREFEKQDDKIERQAREELQKEADREKRINREQVRALGNAAMTGCDPKGVHVEPRATGSYSWTTHVKVRVTNVESVSVDIDDESGSVVKGLCSGGSITLFRSRNMWKDGDYMSFRYTARGRFSDGSLGIVESPSYRLSAHDVRSGRTQRFDNWEIRLRKVRVQK